MFKESDYLVALQAATRLFDGDERKAIDWLAKPARAFAGLTPLAILETEGGVDKVVTLVGQIEHGVVI